MRISSVANHAIDAVFTVGSIRTALIRKRPEHTWKSGQAASSEPIMLADEPDADRPPAWSIGSTMAIVAPDGSAAPPLAAMPAPISVANRAPAIDRAASLASSDTTTDAIGRSAVTSSVPDAVAVASGGG